MGGSVSTPPILETEMMDIASDRPKVNGRVGSHNMYPEHELSGDLTGNPGESRDLCSSYDVIGDIMNLKVRAIDSASMSSGADSPRYSDGIDACASLQPSPVLRPHSTPKNARPKSREPRLSNVAHEEALYNGDSGDSGFPSNCGCDAEDCTTCEIIVTKHESVVSKTILTPSRWSRTFSATSDGSSPGIEHRPRWKIEVEMESTRVIDNAMEREPGDTFEASLSAISNRKEMKDECTETSNGLVHSTSDLTKDTFDSSDNNKNRKKSFWSKKKKRKGTSERHKPLNSTMAENSSTLSRNLKRLPFLKHHDGVKEDQSNGNPKSKESIYAEKMRYIHVAARVTGLRPVDVRVTLLVETPIDRLTYAQLATKTHLLDVTLSAFFHPYPNTYVEWIESVAEIVRERLEVGDITPKFGEAEIEDCRVCLVLSPDASILLCKPDCVLIHDLANIAGYPVRNTFVMEATDSREETRPSTPVSSTASEQFAPIEELDEFEECLGGEEVPDQQIYDNNNTVNTT